MTESNKSELNKVDLNLNFNVVVDFNSTCIAIITACIIYNTSTTAS